MSDDTKSKATKLTAQVESLLRTAKANHESLKRAAEDLARATAEVEELEGLQQKCAEATECLDDEDFVVLVSEILVEVEVSVVRLRAESALELSFFKSKPKLDQAEPPPSEKPDKEWRNKHLVWRLGNLDLEHPQKWIEVEKDPTSILDMLSRIRTYERHTWFEIEDISDHSHSWEDDALDRWEKPSQERVLALNLDDRTNWYQFEIDKRGRLIGFREGNVFNAVWWDREHEVYKTKRKRLSQR